MKASWLVLLVMAIAFFLLTLASWPVLAAPVDTSADNPIGPYDQSTWSQTEPADESLDPAFGTISMPSLGLGAVDLGLGLFVQETTVSPDSRYGVGIMLSLKGP
jgi:hypothetical protein